MFHNRSFATQILWTGCICLAIFLFLGVRALEGNRMTQGILKEFFHDLFRSMNSLESIEELYETVVRQSTQSVLMGTMQPSDVIEPIEKAIFDAGVRLKEYTNVEHTVTGEHDLLDQALENAIADVNLSWIVLKEYLQEQNYDLAKIQAYILKELYPRLDVLNQRYLHLFKHWMNQLNSEHTSLRDELQWHMHILWVTLVIGSILIALLLFHLLQRIRQAIVASADQINEIKNQKTNFTARMSAVGDVETYKVADSVNQWMHELGLVIRRIKVGVLSVWRLLPQLTGGMNELVGKVGDFSRFTTEVGKTANDISFTSKELVKLMTDVSHTATDTAKLAESGQTELIHLEATMKQMEEASRKISKRLAIISEKAANITMVVTTINKFADQTNLLSLNASIEAEKAGEYGLGFGVVAREIRRLADQVARATFDIEQMVKEMTSAVTSGVMEMDQFSGEVNKDVRDVRMIGSQFVQIIEQVQTLIPHFASVHSSVQAQATGAQHISDSMVHLNAAVEKTAALLSNASSKMHHMNEAVETLHTEMQACIVDQT